ncbi:Gp49 family protein [Cronobacter sakazakii]|uniref:Gp49 family protein n=1 Tax=Cronobacter sakazakii TaxID=28141 RepID=UPI000CFE2E43|nr:Gp49 family protein [Cronobacter sakazakii]
MTDMDIEKEIVAKGKTAARITPERIESVIRSEHYFTAFDGRAGAVANENYTGKERPLPGDADLEPLKLLTFCVLVLENGGFTVTGESACASPENFDPEIGRKIARQNAIAKIWPLEGYLLLQQLHEVK